MISYAQNREDVLLQRFFEGDQPQVFVDVGAGHPTIHSVTRHFYDLGWHGINIEPRLDMFALLKAERTKDINLCIAIADEPSRSKFYHVQVPMDAEFDGGGLSTCDRDIAESHRAKGYSVVEQSIEMKTLASVLNEHRISDIGFLKIDVEGKELSVLQGMDWHKYRPRIVVMESTTPETNSLCNAEEEQFLSKHGYLNATFDGLNVYYVREEDKDRASRLRLPVNILDNYSTYDEVRYRLMAEHYRGECEFYRKESQRLQQDFETLLARFAAISPKQRCAG